MSRQRRKSHEPSLETLESRQLLSLARQPALTLRALQAARRAFHEQLTTPRPDLDDFARQLAHHPRQATIDYGAFGAVLGETNPGVGGRLAGFAGLQRDTATGLGHANHRYLLSVAGIWTTQDPLGFAAGDTNLTRYVGNGSTNSADPSGLDWVWPWDPNADWTDWRIGEAIGDIQISMAVGGTGEVYLGCVHLQGSAQIAGGIDFKNGSTSIGVLGTLQGGQALGAGAGFGATGAIATTGNLEDLTGQAWSLGVSTPIGGVDIGVGNGENPYASVTGSIGPSVGGGVHIDETLTGMMRVCKFQWYPNPAARKRYNPSYYDPVMGNAYGYLGSAYDKNKYLGGNPTGYGDQPHPSPPLPPPRLKQYR